MRINKFLAQHMSIGRRAVDQLITDGKVLINGELATLGNQVGPEDEIVVKGKKLRGDTNYEYIMLNKPIGYVCSKRSQGGDPTIYELLPPHYAHLKSVGRLDKNSSGLILLTNDGEFAHKLTHPSFQKVKKYEIELDKPLQALHQQMINDNGIELPDGNSRLNLERQDEDEDSTKWLVTMHEGRNRQIRRTFAALGYEVIRLHRTSFGAWSLGDLKSGHVQKIIV